MDKLDLRPFYLFVRVAEAGSFSKAAAMLSVGQPELSRTIKELEKRYDVQLLHRNGRGVSLTAAGEQLMAHAQGLLRNLMQVDHELSAVRGAPSGNVTIGVPPLFGHVLNFDLIRRMHTEHPKVSLLFMEGFTTDFLEWLAKGSLDMAVMYNPPSISTLLAEHLLDDRLCLVGVPGSLEFQPGSEIAFKTLATLPLVMPPKPHRLRAAVDSAAKEANVALRIDVEATGTATILDLVRGRIGYTILPQSLIAEDAGDERLHAWPLADPKITPRLFLVTSMQRPVTMATKCAIDNVRKIFGARSPRHPT
jgi:LysR family transcriptional regulator, nitrogen assimilation regulatory protein